MNGETVRARVEAFIADFHAAWQRSGSVPMPAFNPFTTGSAESFDPIAWAQSPTPPDFAAWEQELATLVDVHFTPGARTGAEGSLSGKPAHDPAGERIVDVEVRRTRADVRTVFPDVNHENHFTYRLTSSEAGWRISKIVHTLAPPDAPLLAADDVERLVAAIDPGQRGESVPADLAAGVSALFSGRYQVIDLGTITTSGVLTVHDFGWVRYDLAPVNRRVAPGTYPVDLAQDSHGTNVAIRVRFSDAEAVTRFPATKVGSGHVIGVDAGNVAILDFLAITSCSEAQVEEIYQDQMHQIVTHGTAFSLTGAAPEAVVVQSGYGDGAYPAYWGVSADGSLADLVVDFLINIEDITTRIAVPWRTGPVEHPELARHEFEVIGDADGTLFRYREQTDSTRLTDIRVLGADGRPIEGRGRGVFVQGGTSEQRWRPDKPIPDDATIEVGLSHGYRHT